MKGKTYQTNMPMPQAPKHKVREFNELISCQLCNGYLINPTTVDYCYHTYCRSCIVKYLQTNSVCPQCKSIGGKRIDVNNLKIDDILRKFIFKLVPGLYHEERERLAQNHEARNTEALMEVEENFFSLTEPISLSLEYHPNLLANCSEDQKPPIRYLQCPAGVKIQHLKHLICAKYEIDPENKNVEVEIIYEDEVLQNDFSLMDVGYCYNWNRAAPMRFRYRILIYAPENKLKAEETEINKQLKLKKEHVNLNVNVKVDAENNVQQTRTSVDREKPLSGNTKSVTFATEKTYIDAPKDEITDCNNQNINNNNNHQHYNNNNDGNFNRNVEYKLKSSLKVRKSKYKIDNDYDEASGLPPPAVKMVIARKPALVVEPQRKTALKRSQSEISAQNNNNNNINNNNNNNNNNNKNSTIVTNDFKSLRSNDMRYSDYAVTSSTTTNQSNMSANGNKRAGSASAAVADNNNKLPKNDKTQLKLSTTTTTSATSSITKPAIAQAAPTVVVSIPRFPLSASSTYDKDELFENVTLAQLKTASSKKITENNNSTTTTSSINQNAATKVENNLPRLKIELNSLKTKFTLPKSSTPDYEDVELGLKTHKVRKRAYEEVEPTTEQVDLETYAKNIGLKPIDSVKYSPNASPHSSNSNSSNSSALTNFESTDLDYPSSTHKKRKKKHHSKEGNGGSKKRKLHAEISSQNGDESLKMKVKITAAHSHRGHHKLAAISEEKPATTNGVVEQPAKKECLEKIELVEKEEDVKTNIIPASPPLPPSLFKTVPPLSLSSEVSLQAPVVRKTKVGVSNATTTTTTITPTTKPASPKLVMPKTTTTTITTTTPTITPQQQQQQQQQQQKTFAVPALPTRATPPPVRKFNNNMPATIASAAHKQQQQQQQQQKKSLKQLEHERQVKQAMDNFSHNFKLPKLPIVKSTTNSPTFMPTFDNRPLYTPLASAALSDFTKRLGSNTVTITSRPKTNNSNKSSFQMQQQQQQQQTNNQIKTSLDFMRAANAGKAAALSFAAARSAKANALNGTKEESRSNTLMGPPLSTILKSPKKAQNSKLPTHSLSALSFNMSPHTPLSIASLAAVAAAAGNINSTTNLPHGVRSPPLPLTTALAAAKNKSPYRQTPPALINLSNPVNMMFPDMYRPLVRNNKTSALDLSGNSLEAALNKMKQNIMSCTVTTAERELAGTTTTITTSATESAHNLQSLQNLSKEREKLTTMFEKPKSPAAMVRPQNASVRNIPNPSALAFRNQPASTSPPTTPTTPTTTTASASASAVTSVCKNVALNVATSNVNTNSNNQSPPLRATKKPTTIDQVAANLNMRAAAAALSAAVTNTTTSTSGAAAATTTVVKSQADAGKVIKIADTTTTTNGDTTTNTKEEKSQETKKSTAIENTTTTTTTIMQKPASNLKSISENSCTSPTGLTKVTSIKLEKIAVE